MSHHHTIFSYGKLIDICHNCYYEGPTETKVGGSFTKEDKRALHWQDIQSRVKTHEGEFITGTRGREYQKKWSRQYLGKDLYKQPVDRRAVEQFQASKKW